ncbi:MAG: HAMP domain-containing sensor histidine kinase [Verrucomicrobiota bacterium]
MERNEALTLLSSKSSDDRLRAARFLARQGQEDDVPAIQTALTSESNRWAKSAMTKAIAVLRNQPAPVAAQIGAEGEDERSIEQIYADAVEETTQRLVHEIRPIVGRLDVYASREVPNYDSTKTKAEWTRLQELLTAIDKLGQAASAPVYKEFDLAELLERIISSETDTLQCKIQVAGNKPFVMIGAADLIQLVVANAIRNALEAMEGVAPPEPVVVNWGATDRDYWIAVLDRGRGLPSGFSKVFEIGTTTKKGHLGMGLALARQAALTLNGSILLSPRDPSGAKFEFRWPHAST